MSWLWMCSWNGEILVGDSRDVVGNWNKVWTCQFHFVFVVIEKQLKYLTLVVQNQCGFVWWIDLPLSARTEAMSLPLLQKNQRVEHEIGILKERELNVRAITVILWIHLIQCESEVEDVSVVYMEVRSWLMKKRTTFLEDEVMLRKGREKNMWIAHLPCWCHVLIYVLFKLW